VVLWPGCLGNNPSPPRTSLVWKQVPQRSGPARTKKPKPVTEKTTGRALGWGPVRACRICGLARDGWVVGVEGVRPRHNGECAACPRVARSGQCYWLKTFFDVVAEARALGDQPTDPFRREKEERVGPLAERMGRQLEEGMTPHRAHRLMRRIDTGSSVPLGLTTTLPTAPSAKG
jgi:hypothetical protein